MAQLSLYKVTFSLQNAGGKVTAGPYTAIIGVSGGTSSDPLTHTLATSLATAISNNLLSILQSMNSTANQPSGVPGGTIDIITYAHASVPNAWS